MTVPVLIAFAVIVVVAVAGVLSQVCYVSRTGGLAPSLVTPTEREDTALPAVEPALPAPRALPRKASTPRGIRPPASPQLTTLTVSVECAEGMCGICPSVGDCQCTCLHNSAEIVRRNAAEYDRTHGKVTA